jgi:hypothetical protein
MDEEQEKLRGLLGALMGRRPETKLEARMDIGLAIRRKVYICIRRYDAETRQPVGNGLSQFGYTDSLFDLLATKAPFTRWVEVFSVAGRVLDENNPDDDRGLLWELQDDGGELHARDLIDRWGRSLFREPDTGLVPIDLHLLKQS